MANLVPQDDIQDGHRLKVPYAAQFLDDQRSRIEAARLEDAWDKRHARKWIGRSLDGHLPQPVVCREAPVIETESTEPITNQVEVISLFGCHPDPAGVEIVGERSKTIDAIESEIDRIELDMRYCVQQSRMPFATTHPAPWHFLRSNQQRQLGTTRFAHSQRIIIMPKCHAASLYIILQRLGQPDFFVRATAQQRLKRAQGNRIDQRRPGSMPFMLRIIFCMPPFENCFIIF